MKVKATKQGFFNNRLIEAGEVFELKEFEFKTPKGEVVKQSAEDQFHDSWMEKISAKKGAKKDLEKEEQDYESSESDGSVI